MARTWITDPGPTQDARNTPPAPSGAGGFYRHERSPRVTIGNHAVQRSSAGAVVECVLARRTSSRGAPCRSEAPSHSRRLRPGRCRPPSRAARPPAPRSRAGRSPAATGPGPPRCAARVPNFRRAFHAAVVVRAVLHREVRKRHEQRELVGGGEAPLVEDAADPAEEVELAIGGDGGARCHDHAMRVVPGSDRLRRPAQQCRRSSRDCSGNYPECGCRRRCRRARRFDLYTRLKSGRRNRAVQLSCWLSIRGRPMRATPTCRSGRFPGPGMRFVLGVAPAVAGGLSHTFP